ncbi:hypothetical protein [Pseudogulbenkiania sp. MAI-1]|uniref:CHASE3 domain-containing protein n=1 Tax=Pseudogulbenkiania sp. MAI-1 TaxID=990370 RepID=UPI0012EC577A|nr:hypothetical protein [Pseudogulbenkiania sp. MAI-1]
MNLSSIGKKLYLGFLVVLIVMAALVLSSWQSLRQLHEANELNTHSYQVVSAIDGLCDLGLPDERSRYALFGPIEALN